MPTSKLIVNANVVDAESETIGRDMNVLARNGRIEFLSRTAPLGDADVIDARGAYVAPGLIDAHVHLFLDAGPDPRNGFLDSDDATKWKTAAHNAGLAIAAGITTVRDCGGPAGLLFRLQRAVQRGEVAGPRILAAGSPLTRPKGHCHFFGVEVATAAEVRLAVDDQVRQGASFIKLMASGGGLTPGTSPSEADLPLALMREAVQAARANGLTVSAHCHAVESMVRALDAGVEIIEHASFVRADGMPVFDAEIAARMKDQETIVSPTAISGIRIARAMRKAGAKSKQDRDAIVRLEARKLHTARFREAGVRIVAGSDCGVANTAFDSLTSELMEYAGAGMSSAAALRSATSESARYLRQPLLGRIQPEYAADLLFLKGNPLEDLNHLRNPLLVMKAGEIVCDFRPPPFPMERTWTAARRWGEATR